MTMSAVPYMLLLSGIINCVVSIDLYIRWDDNKNKFVSSAEKVADPVAWGRYENAINKTGWGYLEVYTNGHFDDLKQAYAAGLVEAGLTKDLIAMHWYNTFEGYCSLPLNTECSKLQKYLDKNLEWMTKQIAANSDNDIYWHQVQLFMEQQAGLIDGFSGNIRFPSKYTMDVTGLVLLQISGDMEDLGPALGLSRKHVLGSGSCSALVKVLPNNQDLYVAQDTWSGYNVMLRLLKKYDFHFYKTTGGSLVPGNSMTFSSYPGTLFSGDDLYTINTGLVPMETTIGNSNPLLWKYVTPEGSVLEVIRNMVANRLATSAKEWADIFSRYNSGTYNNQWMIVDYKMFTPGKPLKAGLFHVLEQIPGLIISRDLTQVLIDTSYFASYNTPYYPEIFNASGCWENVKKYGDWFTYDRTARAQIFQRDHGKVKNIDTMTQLMRYNDFTHDPLSYCNCTPPYSAENGISARSDLNSPEGSYAFSALGFRSHGGIDMKLTSSSLAKSLQFVAISSPAYDNVPTFEWSTAPFRDTVRHAGHPNRWNFRPVTHIWGNRNQ